MTEHANPVSQSSNSDSKKSYYDVVAEQYDAISSSNIHLAENQILQSIFQALVVERGSEIKQLLDFGCGTGLGYELSREHLCLSKDSKYIGYDVSEEMLKVCAQKHSQSLGVQIELHQSNINEMSAEDMPKNSDAILMTFGSFSYVEDPKQFFTNVRQVLSPGNGHILLMAYSRFSIRNQLMAKKTGDQSYLDSHRAYAFRNDSTECEKTLAYFYTSEQLSALAYDAGFQHIDIKGMNFNSVEETDCPSIDIAIQKLREEMARAVNQNDAHALILTARNYA